MTRLERARIIRDKILAFPRDQWTWEEVGPHRFLTLKTPEWNASLITAFSNFHSTPEATTFQKALILQATPAPLPNVLDVWLPSRGKVLSVEWDNDDIRLISMQRGAWESELFGLPEYVVKAAGPGGRVLHKISSRSSAVSAPWSPIRTNDRSRYGPDQCAGV